MHLSGAFAPYQLPAELRGSLPTSMRQRQGGDYDFWGRRGQRMPSDAQGYGAYYAPRVLGMLGGAVNPMFGLLGSGVGNMMAAGQARRDFASPYGRPDVSVPSGMLNSLSFGLGGRSIMDQAIADYQRRSGTGLNTAALGSFVGGGYSGPKGVIGEGRERSGSLQERARATGEVRNSDYWGR